MAAGSSRVKKPPTSTAAAAPVDVDHGVGPRHHGVEPALHAAARPAGARARISVRSSARSARLARYSAASSRSSRGSSGPAPLAQGGQPLPVAGPAGGEGLAGHGRLLAGSCLRVRAGPTQPGLVVERDALAQPRASGAAIWRARVARASGSSVPLRAKNRCTSSRSSGSRAPLPAGAVLAAGRAAGPRPGASGVRAQLDHQRAGRQVPQPLRPRARRTPRPGPPRRPRGESPPSGPGCAASTARTPSGRPLSRMTRRPSARLPGEAPPIAISQMM